MKARVIFDPPVGDPEALADLAARARWMFAGTMKAGLEVVIETALVPPGRAPGYLADVSAAPALRYAPPQSTLAGARVRHTLEARLATPDAHGADALLDPDEPDRMSRIARRWLDRLGGAGFEGEAGFARLVEALGGADKVTLIGSGPSLATLEAGPGVNVYTGAAALRPELFSIRPPHVIVAADAAGQLGPSRAAAQWREAVFEAQRAHGAWVVVTEPHAAPLRAWWPEALAGRVIACPREVDRPPGLSLSERFSHAPTGNVLTSLALPLAASLADRVTLVGFDALAGPENQADAWRHADETRHLRRACDAWLAHPAFGQGDMASYRKVQRGVYRREAAAFMARGLRIEPKPDALDAHAPPGDGPAQRLAEAASRALAIGAARPGLAGGLAGAAAGVGGLMLPATIYLALLGAVLAATGIGGFFYLRRRVDVLAARQARRLAEEQARTLRALAARIDVLEAGEHER